MLRELRRGTGTRHAIPDIDFSMTGRNVLRRLRNRMPRCFKSMGTHLDGHGAIRAYMRLWPRRKMKRQSWSRWLTANSGFFSTLRDEMFGYLLHPIDLATNKVSAACGRREPLDVVDLLTIHDRILPLGAAVWAATGKALGFTPEGIINEIRRNARYTEADFRRVASDPPVDPAATMKRLREILVEAEDFVTRMPTEKAGVLFLKDGKVVQPDPGRVDEYQTHAGRQRGHWPTSIEIDTAMFER